MDRVIKTTVIIILLLCTSRSPSQSAIMYGPEEMGSDLEKFALALKEVHPGTFTHQSEAGFDEFLGQLKAGISEPLDGTDFYRILLRLVARVHDGHTQAYATGKLGGTIYGQKRLPFQVHVENERIFIVKDLSGQEIPEGSEIISLDGHLGNGILRSIMEHYSSDGKSGNGMYHWLGGPYRPFNRLYPEIFGENPEYALTYRVHGTKKVRDIRIKGITAERYSELDSLKYPSQKEDDGAFSFELHKDQGYAHMKLSRLVKDNYGEPEHTYTDFYHKCFGEISRNGITNLIIDLRDNGGGKASNAAYLLQYFIKGPIVPATQITVMGNDAHFREWTKDTLDLDSSFGLVHNGNGTYKVTRTDVLRDLMVYSPIKEHAYSGKLIVLINGGTASAGAILAGLLKERTNAVLVGSETYGYAGISNGVRQLSIYGDHTETAIYLPLLHAEYDMPKEVGKRSVVPDHHISNSIRDILSKRDRVMEFALKALLE